MDIKEISKEIKTVIEENDRLSHLKERMETITERLSTMSNDLNEIIKELNPSIRIGNRSTKNPEVAQAKKDLYEKMTAGIQITKKLLRETYSNFQESDYGNIMQTLKVMPNVQSAKDGSTLRLFI